ncbi:MAG: dipeptide ABC transporter ATP-binding protein DppD [Acidimicrobiaceae bacterium]|nr:dipeptide ABC transporter ATP-binding protein DppD [Acidimicrobiaceae bacterium]
MITDGSGNGAGPTPLLDVRELSVFLPAPDGREVQILDEVTFSVDRGTTLGLIGESGSGKSMTALAILRLLPAGARVEGQVLLDGVDLLSQPLTAMKSVRGRRISIVFQEPMTALDPVFTIGYQISQTLRAHREFSRRAAREAGIEMLTAVGIPDPSRRYDEYPHQLSGGMRQRAMIAMALICQPELLIADEPTTAVDITIQAQLLALLRDLNLTRETAILFVSHDIGVIAEMCRDVVVMYAGQVVESCSTDDLLERPRHPYSSGLMWAVPRIGSHADELFAIPGRVPLPGSLPDGCSFHPRCGHVQPSCIEHPQSLDPVVGQLHHRVRCHRSSQLDLPGVLDEHPVSLIGGDHVRSSS